jgi:hypothetical protein
MRAELGVLVEGLQERAAAPAPVAPAGERKPRLKPVHRQQICRAAHGCWGWGGSTITPCRISSRSRGRRGMHCLCNWHPSAIATQPNTNSSPGPPCQSVPRLLCGGFQTGRRSPVREPAGSI